MNSYHARQRANFQTSRMSFEHIKSIHMTDSMLREEMLNHTFRLVLYQTYCDIVIAIILKMVTSAGRT